MLTKEYLESLFFYDPITGSLLRKTGRNKGKIAGSDRVTNRDAYRLVYINGKHYYEHRIAWIMTYGDWPIDQIDHLNGNGLDNSILNLRSVTVSENKQNVRFRALRRTIILGVYISGGKFRSRIGYGNKNISLGSYDCLFEAVCARRSAEIRYGFLSGHKRIILV